MLNIRIFYLISLTGILAYIKNSKNFLLLLIRIEYLIISLYILIFITFNRNILLFNIIYLVISVAERSLGLSLLISIRRSSGRDYILLFSQFNYVYYFYISYYKSCKRFLTTPFYIKSYINYNII